jgi:prepilin-type processing-associated H-X9-DG protein
MLSKDEGKVEGPFGFPFGSAHPEAFNMALCDGSVRSVSYDVDQEVHRQKGNRHDDAAAPR